MREHLYVRRQDSKRSLQRYFRELHVCPSIKPAGGVHLAVTIDLDGPPPGAEGHQRQIGAGLNLTPKQARKVVQQMQAILDGHFEVEGMIARDALARHPPFSGEEGTEG